MRQYTTTQGDAWDGISFKLYSDERYSTLLMEANPSYISTTVFSGGITLNVPEKPVDDSNDLPPWKRGIADE